MLRNILCLLVIAHVTTYIGLRDELYKISVHYKKQIVCQEISGPITLLMQLLCTMNYEAYV